MTTNVAETILGLDYRCYSDPYGTDNSECSDVDFKIFTARGVNFPYYPDGFSASDALQNYSKDIPYNIAPEAQWRLGYEPSSPRSVFQVILPVMLQLVPEINQLLAEPDYTKAMNLADVLTSKLRNATYKGVPLVKLSAWQVATAEGLSMEEARLAGDLQGIQQLWFTSFLISAASFIRSIAQNKLIIDGPTSLVTPMGKSNGVLRRIGMQALVNGLLDKASAKGVQIFYGRKVVRIRQIKNSDGQMFITLDNGRRIKTGTLFLNIPNGDLLSFGQTSEPVQSATDDFMTVLSSVDKVQLSKLYCYWEDAWWLTKLNFTRGTFQMSDETLFKGRYHDGDVQCKDPGTFKNCRGSLLVSYASSSVTGADPGSPLRAYNPKAYWPFGKNDALRKLIPGQMSSHQQMHFEEIHSQLRRVHKKTFELVGMDSETAIPMSEGCVYADWREVGFHINFGAVLNESVMTNEMFTKPIQDLNLSLVNEYWSEINGWAEGSLLSAERALFHVHGLPKPDWMDEPFHDSMIRKFNMV